MLITSERPVDSRQCFCLYAGVCVVKPTRLGRLRRGDLAGRCVLGEPVLASILVVGRERGEAAVVVAGDDKRVQQDAVDQVLGSIGRR